MRDTWPRLGAGRAGCTWTGPPKAGVPGWLEMVQFRPLDGGSGASLQAGQAGISPCGEDGVVGTAVVGTLGVREQEPAAFLVDAGRGPPDKPGCENPSSGVEGPGLGCAREGPGKVTQDAGG